MSRVEKIGDATLYLGDSRELLRTLDENSVDSIVCDPPYHLTTGKKGGSGPASVNLQSPYGRARVTTGFMGMTWDGGDVAHDPDFWSECLRVAKPGAYLLAFGGTRTFHRLACAIEDAGWELRDTGLRGHTPEDCPWLMAWGYGSGFPKSHNGEWGGTALKPAWEPIVMARKPLIGTVSENFAEHGTGGLRIDECRIAATDGVPKFTNRAEASPNTFGDGLAGSNRTGEIDTTTGRWPANLIHDGSPEVLRCFPQTESGEGAIKRASSADGYGNAGAAFGAESRAAGTPMVCYGDAGSAARFFYCAKATREDRDEGCEAFAKKALNWSSGTQNPGSFQSPNTDRSARNFHPTVKPTDLMRWLVRLVTPPCGLVLDPFMGSGSTGKAAMLEGMRFVGIDLTAEYVEIARARIYFASRQGFQPDLLSA